MTLGQGLTILVSIVSMVVSAWITIKIEVAEIKVNQTNQKDRFEEYKRQMEKDMQIKEAVEELKKEISK